MSKPVIKESSVNFTVKSVLKKYMLNYTDIIGNSNKQYSIELVEASNNKIYLYSKYGRVGAPNPTSEYRACSDQADGEKELEKIVKSKLKKGYQKIDLIATSVGSEVAKSMVEPSVLSEQDVKKLGFKVAEDSQSTLHPAIQSVVKTWFGSIEQFVIDNLDTSKCALGQLSLGQINKGRDLLLEARQIVQAGAKDLKSLNDISSKYYSNIPMNFGYKRLNADQLRLDTNDKLDKAFDLLDTLEGAKDVERILSKKNAIDEQYKSLKTGMEWIDPQDPVFKWIDLLFHKTRADNHNYLGKIKICNIFKLIRDDEYEKYMNTAIKFAKQGHFRQELPPLLKNIWNNRVIEHKEYEKIYDKVNVLPLFHGTRTPNFSKILSSHLKLPKPGFTVSGAMFSGGSGGIYFGHSSKAINYSSSAGSYWSKGKDKSGFIFLSDVILGKQKIANVAYPYTLDEIHPCLSVWAKGGRSVINDEFIVFTENQNWLRYIIEFETHSK